MGAALAAGAILSLTAYLAVDLLGDIRGDIKDLGGKIDAMQASVGADIKDLGGKIDATQGKMDALQGKIDALVQEKLISRLTRLEDARLLRK
jgi:peptidoglycan hydrolase CwlO-like protein